MAAWRTVGTAEVWDEPTRLRIRETRGEFIGQRVFVIIPAAILLVGGAMTIAAAGSNDVPPEKRWIAVLIGAAILLIGGGLAWSSGRSLLRGRQEVIVDQAARQVHVFGETIAFERVRSVSIRAYKMFRTATLHLDDGTTRPLAHAGTATDAEFTAQQIAARLNVPNQAG